MPIPLCTVKLILTIIDELIGYNQTLSFLLPILVRTIVVRLFHLHLRLQCRSPLVAVLHQMDHFNPWLYRGASINPINEQTSDLDGLTNLYEGFTWSKKKYFLS